MSLFTGGIWPTFMILHCCSCRSQILQKKEVLSGRNNFNPYSEEANEVSIHLDRLFSLQSSFYFCFLDGC